MRKKLRDFDFINIDYEETTEYISKNHTNIKLNESDELKNAFRSIHSILIWNYYLKQEYINEILSNNIMIFINSLTIDKKLSSMLFRNSIDNLMAIFSNNYNITFLDGVDMSKKNSFIKRFLRNIPSCHSIFDRIYNDYKTYCNYVHSTDIRFLNLHSSIDDYLQNIENKKVLNKLFSFNKDINSILYIFYYDKIAGFQKNHRDYISTFAHNDIVYEIEKYLYL